MPITDYLFPGDQDVKIFGFYWGIVVDTADPDISGRVRVKVEGLIEPRSTWARPLGLPAGGRSAHGTYAVPLTGSLVVVGFIQGDIDEPFYFSGGWGIDGVTSEPTSPAGRIKRPDIDPGDAELAYRLAFGRWEIIIAER